jgi:hypothetical protein
VFCISSQLITLFRFVLTHQWRSALAVEPPTRLLDDGSPSVAFSSAVCRDDVHIVRFSDGSGGILSYLHPSAKYCHTLNNSSGLERKMRHLQISFCEEVL